MLKILLLLLFIAPICLAKEDIDLLFVMSTKA